MALRRARFQRLVTRVSEVRLDQAPVPHVLDGLCAHGGSRSVRIKWVYTGENSSTALSHRVPDAITNFPRTFARAATLSRIDASARSADRCPFSRCPVAKGKFGTCVPAPVVTYEGNEPTRRERYRAPRRRASTIPRRLSQLRHGVGTNRRMSAGEAPRTAASRPGVRRFDRKCCTCNRVTVYRCE